MALISKGIILSMGDTALTNLQEVPDLGGNTDSIEVTTLTDGAHVYTDGLKDYGDSLDFTFLYEKQQFTTLNSGSDTEKTWKVTLSDGLTVSFGGKGSVKLNGVGTNEALTYTLSIKPSTEMTIVGAAG